MFTEHVHSRAQQREATHRKVLASAEKLFREHGYEATTVRQIAADAGVSSGTVMAVGDKAALLVAIFDASIGAVHSGRGIASAHTSDAPAPLTSDQAAQAILDLVEPFIAYFSLDRELSREYAAIIVRGSHNTEVFQNLALALVTEIEAVLSRTRLAGPGAGRGALTIYFTYLGILMAAGNGALDEQAAMENFRDIVRFVVQA